MTMLKTVTRSGKPVLINTDNVAWVVPNENGGTRVVFNATPYILEGDEQPQPIFMDLDVDQSIDEIAAGASSADPTMNGSRR
jgi:hypothetical protein